MRGEACNEPLVLQQQQFKVENHQVLRGPSEYQEEPEPYATTATA